MEISSLTLFGNSKERKKKKNIDKYIVKKKKKRRFISSLQINLNISIIRK
jgi:hypothetical protein